MAVSHFLYMRSCIHSVVHSFITATTLKKNNITALMEFPFLQEVTDRQDNFR